MKYFSLDTYLFIKAFNQSSFIKTIFFRGIILAKINQFLMMVENRLYDIELDEEIQRLEREVIPYIQNHPNWLYHS